jgi:hypothetical protein
MEVEWLKHRQLVPTVGPIVTIIGEFEGPQSSVIKINLHGVTPVICHTVLKATHRVRVEEGSYASRVGLGSVNVQVHFCVPHPVEIHGVRVEIETCSCCL